MRRTLFFIVMTLLLIIGGKFYLELQEQSDHSPYGTLGGDFTLSGVNSQNVSLSDFKGRVVVIYLGFTHCPDICPTSLSTLANAFRNLPEDVQKEIQPLFISFDYLRDTAEISDEYIKYYLDQGIGLSGNKEQIESIASQYGAYFEMTKDENSEADFTIDHTSRFYIINKKGVLVSSILDGEGSDKLQEVLIKEVRK